MAGLAVDPIAKQTNSGVARRVRLIGALAVVAVTLLFFANYFNRFAGLRSGNGTFTAGSAWLAGILPYRDYYVPSPPLDIMKAAAVLAVFGNKLFALRAFALVDRSLIALVLYLWLARFFRAGHAAMAAVVAIVVSAGDVSDPLVSYSHETVFLAVLSGFVASFALDRGPQRRAALFGGLSGICAGLCLCTKQTIGPATVLAIPVICAVFLARLDGVRKAAGVAICFLAGCSIPVVALLAWLAKLGVLHDFLQQVFVRGPAAKGLGGNQFLVRSANVAIIMWPILLLGLAACFAAWRAVRRSGADEESRDKDTGKSLISVIASAAMAIAAGIGASYAGINILPILPKATIYFVLLTSPVLGLSYGWLVLKNTATRRQAQFCLLAGISFVTASMLSLSWPAYEQMVMPGLGFLTAAVLDGAPRWRRAMLFVVCPAILLSQTLTKLNAPEGFEGWIEPPVREATMRSTLPEMSGFLLPPGMVRLIDGTVHIIRDNTAPGDKIFTYPEMTLFYTLSGRMWPTSSGSHNIDVVSDSMAKEEAERLLHDPPKAIVYYREPEDHLREEEINWRKGRRSGNRDIIAAIETLIKNYRQAGTFEGPKNARTVLVYVRP